MSAQPRWLSWLHQVSLFVSKRYFRAEVRGWENLPDGPCLFVGNHNCGVLVNPEAWVFASHYLARDAAQVPLKALSHDLALRMPLLNRFIAKMGMIPANHESGMAALKAGRRVLVYPGGGWESCRPSRDRDRIDFQRRSGFVRLARESGVPIVPVVAAGAHDGWWIFTRGERIARALGLRRLRIDVFPLGLGLPFGVVIGPVFPFFPLPRKIIVQILPAIPVSASSDDAVLAEGVVTTMQKALDAVVKELPRSTPTRR